MRSWGSGMRIAHQTMAVSKKEEIKEEKPTVICEHCDFKAKNESGLRLHMKKHADLEKEL